MSRQALNQLRDRLETTVLGSESAGELLRVALLAGGHVLIEGAPGIGKTSLAHCLATSIGGTFRRIQFTPDLLPADILGHSLYRMDLGSFEFIPGPVFAHCVLADEINRTSPRVQSALLECMNEAQVTLDGVTRTLPQPFFVIATQNDIDSHGTFPLPEPQLDRFLLSISMALPPAQIQEQILLNHASAHTSPPSTSSPLLQPSDILALQQQVRHIPLPPKVAAYLVEICENLRRINGSDHAVSVRASLALLQAARALAFLRQEPAVFPDHLQIIADPVLRHRLSTHDRQDASNMIRSAIEATTVP